MPVAGTTRVELAPPEAIAAIARPGSKPRSITCVAPAWTRVSIRDAAARWQSGAVVRYRSEATTERSAWWTQEFAIRLAWVSITPFGRPVVPDVYICRRTASCGGSPAGGLELASARRRS